jgi:hypothetical protein
VPGCISSQRPVPNLAAPGPRAPASKQTRNSVQKPKQRQGPGQRSPVSVKKRRSVHGKNSAPSKPADPANLRHQTDEAPRNVQQRPNAQAQALALALAQAQAQAQAQATREQAKRAQALALATREQAKRAQEKVKALDLVDLVDLDADTGAALLRWRDQSCFVDSLVIIILFSSASPYFTRTILAVPVNTMDVPILASAMSMCSSDTVLGKVPYDKNDIPPTIDPVIAKAVTDLKNALVELKKNLGGKAVAKSCTSVRKILTRCTPEIYNGDNSEMFSTMSTYEAFATFFVSLRHSIDVEHPKRAGNPSYPQKDHPTTISGASLWNYGMTWENTLAEMANMGPSTDVIRWDNPALAGQNELLVFHNITAQDQETWAATIGHEERVVIGTKNYTLFAIVNLLGKSTQPSNATGTPPNDMDRTQLIKYVGDHKLFTQAQKKIYKKKSIKELSDKNLQFISFAHYHSNSVGGIHYYSYVKLMDGNWYRYNSEPGVTSVDKQEQYDKSWGMDDWPELVFYQRVR